MSSEVEPEWEEGIDFHGDIFVDVPSDEPVLRMSHRDAVRHTVNMLLRSYGERTNAAKIALVNFIDGISHATREFCFYNMDLVRMPDGSAVICQGPTETRRMDIDGASIKRRFDRMRVQID